MLDSLNFLEVDPWLGRPLEDFAEIRVFKKTEDLSAQSNLLEELELHRCTREDLDTFSPFAEHQASL